MDAPLATALALLVALSAVAQFLGRRAAPASVAPAERRSSMVLGLAHAASMTAGVVFPLAGVGRIPLGVGTGWIGVAVMAAGFALQLWAMRTLGPFFTLTLRASATQPLVARGPYRRIRHPGYLGQIVVWLGFAVASRDLGVLGVVLPALAVGYGYRIRAEERMLAAAFGAAWERYAAGRARLVPGLW